MKTLLGLALTLFLALGGTAEAQNTSQIFGRVTDASAAVMPGVTVTLSVVLELTTRIRMTKIHSFSFQGMLHRT